MNINDNDSSAPQEQQGFSSQEKRYSLSTQNKISYYVKCCLVIIGKSLYALFLLYLFLFFSLWYLDPSEESNPQAVTLINDVTQMNPIEVAQVFRPHSTQEIIEIISQTKGAISIGGGRYSMGGQIGADQSLHLDMRGLNKILELNPKDRWIRVQAGATWHDVITAVDQHDLSVQVMQSYSNFTVGGAVSVNAHGRYMGQGAVVHSVRELKVVLADGSLVTCSRDENPELFFSVIGGYGGLAVIIEVTLNLDKHSKIERKVTTLDPSEYTHYFETQVKGKKEIVMHNGDFFPPHYDKIYVTNWVKTSEAPTITTRVQKHGSDPLLYKTYRFIMGWIPGGMYLRPWLESFRSKSKNIEWRNFEASYDVKSLGEISDENGSYILQEYFVPEHQLLPFKKKMTKLLDDHAVEVINISIRHALKDPDTLLSWAPENAYAFVLYYYQKNDLASRKLVGEWTQKLQRAVVDHQGTYYLPYQIWASSDLFHQAYPRAKEYFALKQKYDPHHRFSNRLLQAYGPASLDQRIANIYQDQKLTQRDEQQSYLTVPEWLLVFLSEEQANTYSANRPLEFGYFSGLADFWSSYFTLTKAVKRRHESMNIGYHFMIITIGIVTTSEYLLKGIYENTIGRFFGWFGEEQACQSEMFIGQTYREYSAFINHTPWFQFPWGDKLTQLWSTPFSGGVRCLERKLSFSVELFAKRVLSSVFNFGTDVIYDTEELKITATIVGDPNKIKSIEPTAEVLQSFGENIKLWKVPRYTRFTELIQALKDDIDVIEIAGNRWIVTSSLVDKQCKFDKKNVLTTTAVQGKNNYTRAVQLLPVGDLTRTLRTYPCLKMEHVYDY